MRMIVPYDQLPAMAGAFTERYSRILDSHLHAHRRKYIRRKMISEYHTSDYGS